MAVLAGIDLLGKFLAGSDKSGRRGRDSVRGRFKSFAQRYLALTDTEARLLYQLRNALLHSFGLYSEETDRKGNVTATYNFLLLTQGSGVLVGHVQDDYYRVDVQLLRYRFNEAIVRYEAELRDTSRQDHQELSANFGKMFPKHAKPMSVSVMRGA
jgi:hypothetical protein